MAMLDPIKKAAVYAMSLADNADDVARVVDDWGWKGGKPGEITGGMFENLKKQFSTNPSKYRELEKNVGQQYLRAVESGKLPTIGWDRDVDQLMGDFATLERADIPRAWTGKIVSTAPLDYWPQYPALSQFKVSSTGPFAYQRAADELSKAMRPMTNDQRKTFLTMLPEWYGSLDDLANAARSL